MEKFFFPKKFKEVTSYKINYSFAFVNQNKKPIQ